MTPKEAIERALMERFTDEGGEPLSVHLSPGLSTEEITAFEPRFPRPLAVDIRDLLAFTSGFEFGPLGTHLDFCGDHPWGNEQGKTSPLGVPLVGDGYGNFWVVDVRGDTGEWGPVVFCCHDPPVVMIQATSLAGFIDQIFDLGRPDRESALDSLREKSVDRIWGEDPYLVTLDAARASPDPVVATFARELPEDFRVVDLRVVEVGSGFCWGASGPDTVVKRCRWELLFGVEHRAKKGLLSRLFARG